MNARWIVWTEIYYIRSRETIELVCVRLCVQRAVCAAQRVKVYVEQLNS